MTEYTRKDARKELRRVFKKESFREGQWEIIRGVLRGRDVIGVMPTGSGKSLCYQMVALLRRVIVVVVSPLISLMDDQVLRLDGIFPAGSIHSGKSREACDKVLRDVRSGGEEGYILFVSPERAVSDAFQRDMTGVDIGLFAFDEAHCISHWGHDFRPEYSRVGSMREWSPTTPMLALTASATPRVIEDIGKTLGTRRALVRVFGFYRPNLYFQVETCQRQDQKYYLLERAISKFPSGRVLVYTSTRKGCHDVALRLRKRVGEKVGVYHAGMDSDERARIQDMYATSQIRILVATNAFGMGIDHPDVRLVVHFALPGSIDALYQEMGRAGRDGHDSTCLTLMSPKDKGLQVFFIGRSPPPARSHLWYRLNAICEYVDLSPSGCRHRKIMAYYNQEHDPTMRCGHCDLCAPLSNRKI